jgi:hypothetical protein
LAFDFFIVRQTIQTRKHIKMKPPRVTVSYAFGTRDAASSLTYRSDGNECSLSNWIHILPVVVLISEIAAEASISIAIPASIVVKGVVTTCPSTECKSGRCRIRVS